MSVVLVAYVRDDMDYVDYQKWAIQQFCQRRGARVVATISGNQDLPEESFEVALDVAKEKSADLVVWRDDILPSDWRDRAQKKSVTVKELLPR